MPQNEVKITITTDSTGAVTGIEQATGSISKMEADTRTLTSKMKDNWLALSAAAMGAFVVISKAAEYMQLGAKALQAEESFKSVTASFNVNADAMLSKMQSVSKGMIEDSDLMQKSVQGFMLGLNDKQMVNLLDASRTAAKIWGQDVTATFDTVVTAVGGGVRAMGPLVRMGLITKEEFELLNKAMAAGVENIDLYKMVMARAEIQMARFSNGELDARERSQKFNAEVKELKETIGIKLIEGLQLAFGGLQWLSAGLLEAAAATYKLLEARARLGAMNPLNTEEWRKGWAKYADELKQNSADAQAAAEDLAGKAAAKFGAGEPRADDTKARQDKAAAAKKELDDYKKHIQAMIDASKDAGKADALGVAMIEWKKKTDDLNPELNETTKEIQALGYEAEVLRKKWGDQDWISNGLAAGTANLREKQKGAFEDMSQDFQISMMGGRNRDLAENDKYLEKRALANNNNEAYITKAIEEWAQKDAFIEEKYADELALAKANAAQKGIENIISIEQKLNDYRLNAGLITEEQSIQKRFAGEQKVLDAKQRTLLVDLEIAGKEAERDATWAKFIDLSQQYYDNAQLILANEKYEVLELNERKLKQMQKMVDLEKQEKDMANQQYESAWQGMMNNANQIGGDYGQGLSQALSGIKGQTDISMGTDPLTQRMDQMREMYMKYLDEQKMVSQEEVQLWKTKERDKQQIELESLLKRAGQESQVDNLRLQNTMAIEQQKLSVNLYTLNIIQGALTAFSAFAGKNNKVMFALSKAVGIAMIWVQTQVAAMSAAAAVAGIPIVGPDLAIAAYAKMQNLGLISMGIAAAAAIGEMASGGAASGAGISAGAGSATSKSATAATAVTQPAAPQRQLVLNVNIYSDVIDDASLDKFARKIAPSISKAIDDNVH